MLSAIASEPVPDGPWQEMAAQSFRQRMADGTLAAFVVDGPDAGNLISCVVGLVEGRIATPANPTGRLGWVFNVATEPEHRRRGHARACLESLLDWYRKIGVTMIDLRTSPDGEALYRSLGFVRTPEPTMRLML